MHTLRIQRVALLLALSSSAAVSTGCKDKAPPASGTSATVKGAAPREVATQTNGAPLSLADPWFAQRTDAELAVLERYLRSSPRWEVREEPRPRQGGTVRFAVRLQRTPPSLPNEGESPRKPLIPDYRTSLNGFYSESGGGSGVQMRVLIGLGHEYGFGSLDRVTRAAAGSGAVTPRLDHEEGQPGLTSYLIVTGARGWTLEIFEQSRTARRELTEQALREVFDELRAALAAQGELTARGYSEALFRETPLRRGAPALQVDEGLQPGIYGVSAWANPGEAGRAFLRVRYAGPDPAEPPSKVPEELRGREGMLLSAERLEPRSVRFTGWSPEAQVLFPYQCEVTVYEGDWEHRYRARFELWFQPASGGEERKLVETVETISGWQR